MPHEPKKIIKHEGKCYNTAKWKFCSYWVARRDPESGIVKQFWCDLYDKEKPGKSSLDECNDEFGLKYEGNTKR